MRSITVEGEAGTFVGTVMLYVFDTIHLKNLIQNLKKVEGVEQVLRIDKTGSYMLDCEELVKHFLIIFLLFCYFF